MIVAEEKGGDITFKDFWEYMSYTNSCLYMIVTVGFSILVVIVQLIPNYIISVWTKQEYQEQQESPLMLQLFIASAGSYILLSLLKGLFMNCFHMNALSNMHKKMTLGVLRAKILFFDSNPIGRIITRFSKDMMMVDMMIMPMLVFISQAVLRTVCVVIIVSLVNPMILVLTFIALIYMLFVLGRGVKPIV